MRVIYLSLFDQLAERADAREIDAQLRAAFSSINDQLEYSERINFKSCDSVRSLTLSAASYLQLATTFGVLCLYDFITTSQQKLILLLQEVVTIRLRREYDCASLDTLQALLLEFEQCFLTCFTIWSYTPNFHFVLRHLVSQTINLGCAASFSTFHTERIHQTTKKLHHSGRQLHSEMQREILVQLFRRVIHGSAPNRKNKRRLASTQHLARQFVATERQRVYHYQRIANFNFDDNVFALDQIPQECVAWPVRFSVGPTECEISDNTKEQICDYFRDFLEGDLFISEVSAFQMCEVNGRMLRSRLRKSFTKKVVSAAFQLNSRRRIAPAEKTRIFFGIVSKFLSVVVHYGAVEGGRKFTKSQRFAIAQVE